MRNFAKISLKLSTERLDISNIFTIAALFRENIIVSEDEWDKWGPKNGAFRPFEALDNYLYPSFDDWVSENLPDGVPKTLSSDFEGLTNALRIRWMPLCDCVIHYDKHIALVPINSQCVTKWRLTLVHECPEKHQLFLWDAKFEFWAKFCLDRHMYLPEDQAFINLLHAWMNW